MISPKFYVGIRIRNFGSLTKVLNVEIHLRHKFYNFLTKFYISVHHIAY